MAFKTLIEADENNVDREAFNACVESIDMIDLARKITTIIPGSKVEFITTQEDDRNYRDHERANGNAGHAEGLVNGGHSAVMPEARSFARTGEPIPV